MEGGDIVPLSLPNRPATSVSQEADPNHDVIAVSAQRVA